MSRTREGAFRPGFEVVRQAILACVAGAQDVSFDADRDDVVVVLNGTRQLFSTMSAGYRMMVGLIADLAIKAVKQNARRLPPQKLSAAEANAS